ncbi:MAG TPA: glycerophosphodiester phosphodiesterase family protein, partial [Acidimicrobiales bacterium]
MADFPFLDWPAPLAFAHQGAHRAGGPPENTMGAFETAVEMGYRYLETDTHATSDGVLVAFHDDQLDRLTDGAGLIGDLPWAEVSKARVRDRDGVPLLEDLLTAWPDVRINIDPKHDAAIEPLADLLERTGTVDRVCIG